jgi:hypothetical protein
MAKLVPEEELFPTEQLSDQTLDILVSEYVAEIVGEYIPTKYEILYGRFDFFTESG